MKRLEVGMEGSSLMLNEVRDWGEMDDLRGYRAEHGEPGLSWPPRGDKDGI